MNHKPTVAFLGTGLMGAPMARRLLRAQYPLRVWNRTAAKAQVLAAEGAVVATSPAEALEGAQVAILMLADKSAIEASLAGPATARLAGVAVVQMGTIAPEESQELARAIAAAGGEYLEAPVLGSVPQAEAGELVVMAGGDEALFRRLEPILRCFSPAPRWVGPVGHGSTLKLALNQLIAALTVAYATSLRMVEKAGVDVDAFVSIVRGSALYAPTFDRKLPSMRAREFHPVNFPTRHMLKDVRLVRRTAQQLGLATEVLASLETLYARTATGPLADADYAAVSLAVGGELGS
jgi:3-hydroxyisobutyrate dehydrogenase-like beta-hydroxyacid dehydrogenase